MSTIRDAAANEAAVRVPDTVGDSFTSAVAKGVERRHFIDGAMWALTRVSVTDIARAMFEGDLERGDAECGSWEELAPGGRAWYTDNAQDALQALGLDD